MWDFVGGVYGFPKDSIAGMKTYLENVMTRQSSMRLVNSHMTKSVNDVLKFKMVHDPKALAVGDPLFKIRAYGYYSERDQFLKQKVEEKNVHIETFMQRFEADITSRLEKNAFLISEENRLVEVSRIWDSAASRRMKDKSIFDFDPCLYTETITQGSDGGPINDPVFFYRDHIKRVMSTRAYQAFEIVCPLAIGGSDNTRGVYVDDDFRLGFYSSHGLTTVESMFMRLGSDLFCHDSYAHAADGLMTHPMNRIPKDFELFMFTVGAKPDGMSLLEFESGCEADHFVRTDHHIRLCNITLGPEHSHDATPNATILFCMIYGIAIPFLVALEPIEAGQEIVLSSSPTTNNVADIASVVSTALKVRFEENVAPPAVSTADASTQTEGLADDESGEDDESYAETRRVVRDFMADSIANVINVCLDRVERSALMRASLHRDGVEGSRKRPRCD